MSVILDALKKLDREKPHRGDRTSNIAAEILKPDLRDPVKRTRVYFLIVTLAVVATLSVTYAVMVEFGFLRRSSSPEPVKPLRLNQQIPPALPDPQLRTEPSPRPVNPSAAVSREPGRDVREKEDPIHPKIEAPVESRTPVETKTLIETKPPTELKSPAETPVKITPPPELKAPAETKAPVEIKPPAAPGAPVETKTPVTSPEEKKTVMPEKTGVVPGSPRKTVEAAPKVSPAAQPSLKVSAIIWYEDASQRFAMINGIKATEGSEVEGVKVVEINPTSVRLLHNGRYFEISMTR